MKVVCISDMHGQLDFKVPEADLLLIAGDLCPAYREYWRSLSMQEVWLDNDFREWLEEQPVKECVAVSGNHDWIWEKAPKRVIALNDNFHYIEDESIEMLGLKIYGTPVQPEFCNWAFNKTEDQIKKHWDNIPEGLDILLLHCPPYGILDMTSHKKFEPVHIGCKHLAKRIKEVAPKVIVFGHNHGEHGIVEEDGIKYINASLIDDEYKMVIKPIIIEL